MKILFPISFSLLLFVGCSLFENSDELMDFGIAEDHFQISDGEKEFFKRNRNFITVEFSDDHDWKEVKQLVSEYDLEFLNPDADPMNSFKTMLRVRSKPAEDYYTRYGTSNSFVFGNSEKVNFALPVYELEGNSKKMLYNQLEFSFSDQISESEADRLVDSLKINDNLVEIKNNYRGNLFRFQLNKSSPMNSLELSNHYETLEFITVSNPIFGIAVSRD